MPILLSPDPTATLAQGDLLKSINLFATGSDWAGGGGSSQQVQDAFSLVLSRPCVTAHKSQFVVAAVRKFHPDVPKNLDSKQIREFLADLRDGLTTPDCFYLGHLPCDPDGRYVARLDSLHTVFVPGTHDMQEFLTSNRLASLHSDFTRDLHVRIFTAFARLGFDDHSWYATEDLRWIVCESQKELLGRKSELKGKESEFSRCGIAGFKNDAHRQQLSKDVSQLKQSVEQLESDLQQFNSVLKNRE